MEEKVSYNFTYYYSDGSYQTFEREIPISVANYIDVIQEQLRYMINEHQTERMFNALFIDLLDGSRLN